MSVTSDSPAARVSRAARALARARKRADAAETALRLEVVAALEAGARGPEIADAAGISRQRVYQIRDGRRT